MKEVDIEINYALEIGDVVLVQNDGFGIGQEDLDKYVEVIGKADYYDTPGVTVVGYDCVLETDPIGDRRTGAVGYETFGSKPFILLNTRQQTEGFDCDPDVEPDVVNSPSHYNLFEDVEAIEVIAHSLTKEEFRGYCFGNLLKYRLRCGKKDNVEQELSKADKYKELYEKYKDLCHD